MLATSQQESYAPRKVGGDLITPGWGSAIWCRWDEIRGLTWRLRSRGEPWSLGSAVYGSSEKPPSGTAESAMCSPSQAHMGGQILPRRAEGLVIA